MKTKKKYIPADYDDLYDAEPHGTIDDRGVCGCRQKTITAGNIREDRSIAERKFYKKRYLDHVDV